MKEVKTLVDEEGNRFEIVVEKEESMVKRIANDIRDGAKQTFDFCKKHPFITISAFLALVDGTCKVTNTVTHARNARIREKECTQKSEKHYDRSNRIWYDLDRPMTNNEKLEFSRRKESGESDGEILRDMNLI